MQIDVNEMMILGTELHGGTWSAAQNEAAYMKLDANGDGFIDYDELGRRFRRHMDKEHREGEREQKEAMQHEFDEADADSSSGVTIAEYAKQHEMQVEHMSSQEKDRYAEGGSYYARSTDVCSSQAHKRQY